MTFLIWLGAIILFLLSLAPYIPKSTLATDTPSHFALQWAIGAAMLLVAGIAFRVHGQVYLVLMAAYFLSVFPLLPFLKMGQKPRDKSGTPVKILQANVWIQNHGAEDLQQLIHDENPDIIAAAELHTPFAALFEHMKELYPHQHTIVSNDTSFGAGVMSKIPFESVEVKYPGSLKIPAIFAKLRIGEKILDLVVAHAENPLEDISARDREFEALALWHDETMPANLIVTGDLNATPWCPALKSMTKRMGLIHARAGRGLMGTYPVWLKLPFLRIPIDHMLVSPTVKIDDFRLGPDIGSDHLPTLTIIRL